MLTALGTVTGVTDAAAATLLVRGMEAVAKSGDVSPEIEAEILKRFGWRYHPELPKSRRAGYDNSCRNTTWFRAFWSNDKTGRVSYRKPSYTDDYKGDDIVRRSAREKWRRGGAPLDSRLTEVEKRCAHIETQGELF